MTCRATSGNTRILLCLGGVIGAKKVQAFENALGQGQEVVKLSLRDLTRLVAEAQASARNNEPPLTLRDVAVDQQAQVAVAQRDQVAAAQSAQVPALTAFTPLKPPPRPLKGKSLGGIKLPRVQPSGRQEVCVCVCLCVCEREGVKERERRCVCVCLCVRE